MTNLPSLLRIYHITHVDNLPSILAAGGLSSDAVILGQGGPPASIGMSSIKQRRLRLPVTCHPGARVGDYVPSYFCPRSIMLYVIHCANHPDLTYRGGQGPILHLEADLHETVAWADGKGRRWAFSLSNAGTNYTQFRDQLDQLGEVNWAAVPSTDFRNPEIKEGKQAEFLVHGFFPWHLVRRIGVQSSSIQKRVARELSGTARRPVVEVRRDWYYWTEEEMIRFVHGDILKAEAEALVNTVNCVGVMGRGIALQFKNIFPANFRAYEAACRREEVQPGRMFVFDTGELTLPRYIINFPTKRHWRGKSRLEDIQAGLEALVSEIQRRKIHSLAIPPLGSGLGGLDWSTVRPLIEQALAALQEVEILVFEPDGVAPAEARANRSSDVPKMTAGRAALLGLMNRYLAAMLDPFISLLEVHKLMYFLQAAGEPLNLRYVKALMGPYSENLRHVLRDIEGHLISGYADGGDAPDKQLTLVPGAIQDAESFLKAHPATHERFDRVVCLVEGFETPFGLELLATVHWVAVQERAQGHEEIVRATYDWGPRKRRFVPAQIDLAAERLRSEGWLPADAGR
jgi:O-acetyl-ADP-ribose deacetylase (regulator of RNase III)